MIAGLVVGLATVLGPADVTFADSVADQLVVQLVEGASIDEVNADYGTTTVDAIPQHQIYLLAVPDNVDEDALEDLLEDDPRIVEAELNDEDETPEALGGDSQSFFFGVMPEEYLLQWSRDLIAIDAANELSTGTGVVVAILDTGIDAAHQTLADQVLDTGYNFVDMTPDVDDVGNGVDDDGDTFVDEMVGHGTFLAGLVTMVAPDAWILPVKVLDSDGITTAFRLAQGIYHAVDQGAHVVNISISAVDENLIVATAVGYARQSGAVVVASAGNSDTDEPERYPASEDGVVGVAATDATDDKSVFSNYGDWIALSAPGTAIVSTVPGDEFGEGDGTSMAAGLVSGAAALLKAADNELTPGEIESVLFQTAEAIAGFEEDEMGAGRLDVADAVAAVCGGPSTADLTGDGVVGTADLLELLGAWGAACSPADLDGDGVVGTTDLFVLLAAWG
jgi:subtilisin family serine protease